MAAKPLAETIQFPSSNQDRTEIAAHPRFLRLSEVRNRVPYSRATIYRLMDAGQFPKPYSLGARAVAWLEAEVNDWIASRIEEQNTVVRPRLEVQP